MLLPGQEAYDRPVLVCRVFHARLQALIHNLKNGHYFGSKLAYFIYVIEFQHRKHIFTIAHSIFIQTVSLGGLPHAHCVFRLKDGPDHADEAAILAFIDQHITARKPILSEESTAEDIKYHQLVGDHMTHTCASAVNGCLDESHFCKRGYSNTFPIPFTYLDEKGYPVYARPSNQDLKVVPHIRQMLLDWEGHCNSEFCASTYALIYLFKYLMKGNKKIQVFLNNTDDVGEADEIKLHLRGRMISSMEAAWRCLSYNIYPASAGS